MDDPAANPTNGLIEADRQTTDDVSQLVPVLAPRTNARSSGRRHGRVDMEADRGTPVVAVRDGAAELKRSTLGGNAIWLAASSGERCYYYAHLDSWEGESRQVRTGDVIGYVGQTGNARGDHLHFETRAGDTATNPYPLVSSACRCWSSRRRGRAGTAQCLLVRR